MLLIPKGITGQWLDCIYWTLAAEMAFYALVFCAMLTRKITLWHLAWGLTVYSAVFNGFALLVLSGAIQSDMLYWVILMFRVPAATWLLSHGCFFALGLWLFISANRKLTVLEQLAVAVTCLSGCAEIYYFSAFLLLLIAVAANRSRHSTVAASPEPAGYWRTLGLITYPLYLTHNVIGSAMIRVLIDAGLDASLSVWVSLGLLVLICWFICEKVEPAIRQLLIDIFANFRLRPKAAAPSPLPSLPAKLGLQVNFSER
jgi:peptidoglycan/LPS O-acetylase OafA/YrhL